MQPIIIKLFGFSCSEAFGASDAINTLFKDEYWQDDYIITIVKSETNTRANKERLHMEVVTSPESMCAQSICKKLADRFKILILNSAYANSYDPPEEKT